MGDDMEILFCLDDLGRTVHDVYQQKKFAAFSALELIEDQFTNTNKRYRECIYISTPLIVVQDDFTRYKRREGYSSIYSLSNKPTTYKGIDYSYREGNIFSLYARGSSTLVRNYSADCGPSNSEKKYLSSIEMIIIIGDYATTNNSFDSLMNTVLKSIGEQELFIGRIDSRSSESLYRFNSYNKIVVTSSSIKRIPSGLGYANTGLLFSLVVNDFAKTLEEAYRFGIGLGVLSALMEISRDAVRKQKRTQLVQYGYVESKLVFQLLFKEYPDKSNKELKETIARGVDDGIETTFTGRYVNKSSGKFGLCSNYYIE